MVEGGFSIAKKMPEVHCYNNLWWLLRTPDRSHSNGVEFQSDRSSSWLGKSGAFSAAEKAPDVTVELKNHCDHAVGMSTKTRWDV